MRCVVVGGEPTDGEGVIALTLEEARRARDRGASCVPFHELRRTDVERAERVRVVVPRWRGNSFLVYLEWLVRTRLASSNAEVSWLVDRRLGRRGTEALLDGWDLRHEIAGRYRRLYGPVPDGEPPSEPGPQSFEHAGLTFASDWGVFSEGHIDDGTGLLLEAASSAPFGSCADVGTGYGPLAVLLGRQGSGPVIASDVDAVALDLAGRNCADAGVEVDLAFEDRPDVLPPTDLTVCNFPTHASSANVERLAGGLAVRARGGRVLVVVHSSLEDRFRRLFEPLGVRCEVVARGSHVVLDLAP